LVERTLFFRQAEKLRSSALDSKYPGGCAAPATGEQPPVQVLWQRQRPLSNQNTSELRSACGILKTNNQDADRLY